MTCGSGALAAIIGRCIRSATGLIAARAPLPQRKNRFDSQKLQVSKWTWFSSPTYFECSTVQAKNRSNSEFSRCFWRHGAYLWLLAPVLAVAAEPLNLELLPAWNGWARSGAVTELGVRVTAEQGGDLIVTVATSNARVETRALLEPQAPLTLWLPVQPDGNSATVVTAVLAGHAPVQREFTDWQWRTTPLVAVVGNWPDSQLTGHQDWLVFRPDLAALPHTPQGYQSIAALLLDTMALISLDKEQLAALRGYLGGCGKLVLGGPPAATGILQRFAGCQGRFVRRVEVPEQGLAALASLWPEQPPILPGMTGLKPLLPDRESWRPLALLFAGYALVMLLLAVFVRRMAPLLLAPVAAGALGLAVWSRGGAELDLVSWAEMTSGDASARYAALLRVTGQGRGEYAVTVPTAFGLPTAWDSASPLAIEDYRQTARRRLLLHTRLLEPQTFRFTGVFDGAAPLSLTLTPAGPEIVTTGRFAGSAILAWQGQRYTVPQLPPSARWTPPEQVETWGTTPQERLLRLESATEAALLLPFTLKNAGLLAAAVDTGGWLLIRARQEEQP